MEPRLWIAALDRTNRYICKRSEKIQWVHRGNYCVIIRDNVIMNQTRHLEKLQIGKRCYPLKINARWSGDDSSKWYSKICSPRTQRHILRDRRPSTTACLGFWAMGTYKVKKCAVRKKKYFVLRWWEHQRQDKNLFYLHDEPNKPEKGPYHLYSISPHLPQFQQ